MTNAKRTDTDRLKWLLADQTRTLMTWKKRLPHGRHVNVLIHAVDDIDEAMEYYAAKPTGEGE